MRSSGTAVCVQIEVRTIEATMLFVSATPQMCSSQGSNNPNISTRVRLQELKGAGWPSAGDVPHRAL